MARMSCERCGQQGHDSGAHAFFLAAAAVWARVALVQARTPVGIFGQVLLDRELDRWSQETEALMRRAA